MAGVENMNFGVRNVLAITVRLAGIEREIVLTPDHQQARLFLAHPSLPLGICLYISAIVVEQIALNLRLPRLVEERKLVRPQIRIVSVDIRSVSGMTRPRRLY